MPGFALAKKCQRGRRAHNPDVEGLILLKHGIFSMGATAEEAYVRMIDLVTLAEKRLAKATRKIFAGRHLAQRRSRRRPRSRRSCAGSCRCRRRAGGREAAQRFVFEFRSGPEILAYVARQGDRALQPARTGDARSRHPHQGRAARRCRRRKRASSTRSSRTRRRRSTPSPPTTTPISRATTCEQMPCQERARSRAAGRAGARARPVRRSATARRTPRSRPTSPRPRSR